MKTKEQMIEAKLKVYRGALKLHVVDHMYLPNAVNSFMIYGGTQDNPTGFICGGNARIYIPNARMDKFCYPTVFKSRAEAKRHMAVDTWSDYYINSQVDDYETKLRSAA